MIEAGETDADFGGAVINAVTAVLGVAVAWLSLPSMSSSLSSIWRCDWSFNLEAMMIGAATKCWGGAAPFPS